MAAMLSEVQQNGVFERGATHGLLVHGDRAGIAIDLEPVEGDDWARILNGGRLLAAAVPRVPAQLCLATRHELEWTEGLDHVIVRAEGEALDLIGLTVAGGEHDDGIGALGADGAEQLEAVHIGKHDIEHSEVELPLQDEAGGIGAVIRQRHIESLIAQVNSHEVGDGLLVVHDENARRIHDVLLSVSSIMAKRPRRRTSLQPR